MTIGYKEFENMDGKWVDDLGIISRIVQQYQDSQQSQSQKGATLGAHEEQEIDARYNTIQ